MGDGCRFQPLIFQGVPKPPIHHWLRFETKPPSSNFHGEVLRSSAGIGAWEPRFFFGGFPISDGNDGCVFLFFFRIFNVNSKGDHLAPKLEGPGMSYISGLLHPVISNHYLDH